MNEQATNLVNTINEKSQVLSSLAFKNAALAGLQNLLTEDPRSQHLTVDVPVSEFEASIGIDAAQWTTGVVAVSSVATLLAKAVIAGLRRAGLVTGAVAGAQVEAAAAAAGAVAELGTVVRFRGGPRLTELAARVALRRLQRIAPQLARFVRGLAQAPRLLPRVQVRAAGGIAATVAVTVGVSLILSAIGGAQERSFLEEQLEQLRQKKTELQNEIDELNRDIAALTEAIKAAVDKYTVLLVLLSEIKLIPSEEGKIFSASNPQAVVASQDTVLAFFATTVQIFSSLRTRMKRDPSFLNNPDSFLALISTTLRVSRAEVDEAFAIFKRVDQLSR